MENETNINPKTVFSDGNLKSAKHEIGKTILLSKKLNDISKKLPSPGDKGIDSGSFEDLYAQKEEASEKLEKQLRYVMRYQNIIQNIIEGYLKKLEIMRTNKNKISHNQAKQQYDLSAFLLEKKVREAKTIQTELSRVMEIGTATLQKAKAQEFTEGRKPKRWFSMPALPSATQGAPKTLQTPSPSRHVNDLVSMGPLGEKTNAKI